MRTRPYSVIVLASDAHAAVLGAVMPRPCVRVSSRSHLIQQILARPSPVAFVDRAMMPELEGMKIDAPIVVLVDDGAPMLPSSIAMLNTYQWLAHTMSWSLLASPGAHEYLEGFLDRLFGGPNQRVLGSAGVGRIAMLSNAGRREARLGRMRSFFERNGLSERTIDAAVEVAEELVMNALYDAPFEAGYLSAAVPRTEDIELPPEHACEISYGIEGSEIFVRLRDTFGALTRERLVDVLTRCSSKAVTLDETRGGAGLGLWRIFSAASSVSVTVIPSHLTDIVVSIAARTGGGRNAKKVLRAIDLHFADPMDGLDSMSGDLGSMDQSFTLVRPSYSV